MIKEAFVYCWSNLSNGKIYVGYHKGNKNDGYVCSSKSKDFWKDFNDYKMKWTRQIIGEGSVDDCLELEHRILSNLDLNSIYNNSYSKGIVFTDEVRLKISNSLKGKKWSNSKKEKMLTHYEKNGGSNLGKSFSEETKRKMSESRIGKKDSKETKLKKSLAKKGKKRPQEVLEKISLSKIGKKQEKLVCPHCNLEGGASNLKRYHFDNCKNNS